MGLLLAKCILEDNIFPLEGRYLCKNKEADSSKASQPLEEMAGP